MATKLFGKGKAKWRHQPIKPKSSGEVCLIWNYTEILDILRLYKCTVAAAIAGHAYKGGYKRDEESGIHF